MESAAFSYEILIFCVLFLIVLSCLALLFLTMMTSFKPNISRADSEKYYLDPTKGRIKKYFPSLTDKAQIDLTVVVPAYNEEKRLPVMLDEATSYLEKRQKEEQSFTYEIIIVDDGSSDKTTEIALEYSAKYGTEKIRVLTLSRNRGKGGAVRMGMLSSRGKFLLFADADGATTFADIEKLQKELAKINIEKCNMAVVCGSRAHLEKNSIAERSLFRTILMFGFHFLVWFLCVRGIRDTQCGFKLLTREAARLLFYNLHVERWAFDVDLLHIAQHFKIPVAEVAVNWQEVEGSKLSPLWSSLQMGRDLVLIRLRYILGIWCMEMNPKTE